MIKNISLTILFLILAGCATTGNNASKNLEECAENGILMDAENPEKVNCSEISLFTSDQKKLEWYQNTYKAKLVKQKDLEVSFIYSADGRYYVLISGQEFKIQEAEATLTVNPSGDAPEHISLAAEERFLSGTGNKRSGETVFQLSLKVPKSDYSAYKAKFEFKLTL